MKASHTKTIDGPSKIESLSEMTDTSFEKVVAIKLGADWMPIASVAAAGNCLLESWPDKTGASYRRALNTCEAFLAGEMSMLAVQASFIVAAMELGISVELYEDQFAFLDDQISALAKEEITETGHASGDTTD